MQKMGHLLCVLVILGIFNKLNFRQIYNKLFICINFPPTFIGIRFKDKWTTSESGGIPLKNTPAECLNFAKNPQYYVSFAKQTKCYISILQKDGRLTKEKFPYQNCTRKNCLVIFKVNSKKKIEKYEEKNVLQVSSVRQHRENSIHYEFEKGEYIIIPSIFKAGDIGEFWLEIYFEDELEEKKEETNFLKKLKFSKIERLNPKFLITSK